MMINRRRFLTISAAACCAPSAAAPESWQGHAFGAEISISIQGGKENRLALRQARETLRHIERMFSLYDPNSALVQLNSTGQLRRPNADFLEMMLASDRAYRITDGLFDPTIQRIWQARASGRLRSARLETVGWERVHFDTEQITLGRDQALTFNGIAQGYATDKVTEILLAHGLRDVLVNIGEHRGVGGPWVLGLEDPVHGLLGTRTLGSGAIATSSTLATDLIQGGHIIHKTREPLWSTVSVEAQSATLADSLSTALVLASRAQIEDIRNHVAGVSRITLVDTEGGLTTI